jgi:hypothetical protein
LFFITIAPLQFSGLELSTHDHVNTGISDYFLKQKKNEGLGLLKEGRARFDEKRNKEKTRTT